MKDIKTFIIGFLSCACLFLIMAHSKNAEKEHSHDAEEIQIDNKSFIEKSKTNIDKIIDEETFTKYNGISLKTIYKNDIGLSIHIGG